MSRLKSQGIVDIDRYFDVIDKFDLLAKHIFDEFIEPYRRLYAELGDFKIYTIPNTGLEYRDLLKMNEKQIKILASSKKAPKKSSGLSL